MFVILDSQTHNGVREKGDTKIERTLAAASNAAALYWRQFTVNFLIRLYSINVWYLIPQAQSQSQPK